MSGAPSHPKNETKSEEIYLSTGDVHLNELLSMDKYELPNGIRVTTEQTPVILIDGTTGVGKTTLALQIATAAVNNENKEKWCVCYYSLEQDKESILNCLKNFRGLKFYIPTDKIIIKLAAMAESVKRAKTTQDDYNETYNKAIEGILNLLEEGEKLNYEGSKINLCRFSPRPLDETNETDLFVQHYRELKTMIKNVKEKKGDKNLRIVFFIDSLTAISDAPLKRNEIAKLFNLFRTNKITAVMTLEHNGSHPPLYSEGTMDHAKFFADIVIDLKGVPRSGYFEHRLEIIKSRILRQGLGSHLYKIWTYDRANAIAQDQTFGFVVFPSIHTVVTRLRTQSQESQDSKFRIAETDKTIRNIFEDPCIPANSCISIIGPYGTHKLALAINLGIKFRVSGKTEKPEPTRLLIINFGRMGEVKFGQLAWTKKNAGRWKTLSRYPPPNAHDTDVKKIKHQHVNYRLPHKTRRKTNGNKTPLVTMTTFRIGYLSPEECFDVIEKKINDGIINGAPYTSVILSDTAEISTGFPLLRDDPLFLTSILDLFTTHNMVSVCIGVESGTEKSIKEANLAISAKADYRISLAHYPSIDRLNESIISKIQKGKETSVAGYPFEEQLVSLVIDNVTGKHYGRTPRWLVVEEPPQANSVQPKILKCEKDIKNVNKLIEDKRKSNQSRTAKYRRAGKGQKGK